MSKKPTVLIFVAYYLPGYKSGGPVRSISNLVDHLGDKFNFRIVTANRDALESNPYSEVPFDAWVDVGSAKVYYLSEKHRKLKDIKKILRETSYDVLYLNSFFNPVFTLKPLLARFLRMVSRKPCVVVPRGEFSKGALDIRKLKKLAFIFLVRFFGLYKDLFWQASSALEAKDIKGAMGVKDRSIIVAPNLPAKIQEIQNVYAAEKFDDSSPMRIVFLSRISTKKNLDYAIKVLQKVKLPIHFDVVGAVDDEPYWDLCQKLIKELPKNITVNICGSIPHEKVRETLKSYDLFFFPTRGENFGHVILEALSSGLPVLISDQTPWQDLDENKIGNVLPLRDKIKFIDKIQEFSSLSKDLRIEQKRRAIKYAQRVSENQEIIGKTDKMFRELL